MERDIGRVTNRLFKVPENMEERVCVLIVVTKLVAGGIVRCVERIKRQSEEVSYVFPRKLQAESFHKDLCDLSAVKNALRNLVNFGQYRNVKLTLKDPLVTTYMDEEGNFVFQDEHLEEFVVPPKPASVIPNDSVMSQKKEETGLEETSRSFKWTDIEKRFSIEKFNGKQNAKDWLDSFQTECSRHNVKEDEKKVKCLKLFVTDRALDWYRANVIKLD